MKTTTLDSPRPPQAMLDRPPRGYVSLPSNRPEVAGTESAPPRPTPTWEQLVTAVPRLSRFEQEAREAGENGFADWLRWVQTYGDFKRAIDQGSEATGASYGDCARVATGRLEAEYQRAAGPANA